MSALMNGLEIITLEFLNFFFYLSVCVFISEKFSTFRSFINHGQKAVSPGSDSFHVKAD